MMNQHRPKLHDPRPPKFRTVDEGDGHDEFHDTQLYLTMYQEDEDRKKGRDPNRKNRTCPEADKLIRDACYDAASSSDLFRAAQIATIGDGSKRVTIGPKLGCEILAAIGWLMSD